MRKGRLSLVEAKEKYPDWYERRIVKKERRGRWTVKRDLYDWWLHRIEDEIRVATSFRMALWTLGQLRQKVRD